MTRGTIDTILSTVEEITQTLSPVKLYTDQGFDEILFYFFPCAGGTEVITEDDYQNGHPDLEAASSGRLGVGRDKMVYMAVKNHPKEEEDDDDDSDDDDDDDISMFLLENSF